MKNSLELKDEIVKALEKKTQFRDALQAVIKEVCRHTGWPYGEAWLADDTGKQLKYAAGWNVNNSRFYEFTKFSSICKFARGIGLVGRTWEAAKGTIDKELSISTDFLRYDGAKRAGIKTGYGFFINNGDHNPLIITFFETGNDGNDDLFYNVENSLNETGHLFPGKTSR